MGKAILNFRDLDVYQRAVELQQEIFEASKRFPNEERYSLTDQVRRSSRSIGANIAEAWQKRKYPAHFVSKLSDSDAELAETEHWVDSAKLCRYMSSAENNQLIESCRTIGGMLGKMMANPDVWAK